MSRASQRPPDPLTARRGRHPSAHFAASARRSSAASGRSPAATRPGAGRWPDRWWPRPSSSIPSGCRAGSTIPRSSTPRRARSSTRKSAPAPRWRSRSRRRRASIATTSCALRSGRWRARWRRCRCGRGWSSSTAATASMSGCDCEAVISGDAIVASIAAASIVAKVTRDRLMGRLALAHPGYGFERNMGYSVPEHFAALARLGPTIHHRRSFAPVAAQLWRMCRAGGRNIAGRVASLAAALYLCRFALRVTERAGADALRFHIRGIAALAAGAGGMAGGAAAGGDLDAHSHAVLLGPAGRRAVRARGRS